VLMFFLPLLRQDGTSRVNHKRRFLLEREPYVDAPQQDKSETFSTSSVSSMLLL